MTVYEEKRADGLTQAEWQAKVRAYNTSLPHLPLPSTLNPSGLVPYPCLHGIPVKPKRFAVTRRDAPWLDPEGNEKPPYAGLSWGRSKYLTITAFGGKDGVPYAIAECHVCRGLPVGDDFYVAADGTSLR